MTGHHSPREISGAVLDGGTSRRMGRDKRHVTVDGVPLLSRSIRALGRVADDLLLIGPASGSPVPAEQDGLRRVEDLRPGAGPLGGIETALVHAEHDIVVVVATDHPWIAAPVLALLVHELGQDTSLDAAILGTGHGAQPLIGAYRRRGASAVGALLDTGERRARCLPEVLATRVVPEHDWRALDPSGRTAQDVDTPEDLRAAQEQR